MNPQIVEYIQKCNIYRQSKYLDILNLNFNIHKAPNNRKSTVTFEATTVHEAFNITLNDYYPYIDSNYTDIWIDIDNNTWSITYMSNKPENYIALIYLIIKTILSSLITYLT